MIEVLGGVDGAQAPKMFCESCGGVIVRFHDGAAVYKNFLESGEKSQVALVHKSFVRAGCMTMAEEKVRRTGGDPGWEELGPFFADFIANIGLKPSEIASELKRARW